MKVVPNNGEKEKRSFGQQLERLHLCFFCTSMLFAVEDHPAANNAEVTANLNRFYKSLYGGWH